MNLHNKTVLVTGADGFIGSHLTEMLVKKTAKVKALSYYNSFNYCGWLDQVDCLADIEVLSGDVRDTHYCQRISKGIDVIFHLAALIGIPYSYIAMESYVDTNVKGTLNICQAALQEGCERVIHTSTSEVYGTARYVPIDEAHPLQPQSPYSASKIGADVMALSFYHAFRLPLAIARPFNTYGPRQSARAVIPTVIAQIANGKKHLSLGALHPTRDFNYIKDIVAAFIAIAESDRAIGEVINFGSNYEISIADTVQLIAAVMGARVAIETDVHRLRPENSEVERLWANNRKAKELTGWEPSYAGLTGLRRGLEETIAWFTDPTNLRMYKSNIYNI